LPEPAAAFVVALGGTDPLAGAGRWQPGWFASHELRTPLQAIKGGVELLLEDRATGLSAVQVEALGLIATATADLERCITTLAELAALDHEADIPLERQPLAAWLDQPEIRRHLSSAPSIVAADLEVLVAPPFAMRGFACLAAIAASSQPAAVLTCDLASVDDATCRLGLSIDQAASGTGAIAWQLATALFERAGASLQQSGPAMTVLTLHRPGRAPI
jgi:signal transduction histidine kinase